MSITTVLDSAEDQCRTPVTCGSTPASSGVVDGVSLSSSATACAGVTDAVGGAGATATGTAGGVAAVAFGPEFAPTVAARWPRTHHTPAPEPTASKTTAITNPRPCPE